MSRAAERVTVVEVVPLCPHWTNSTHVPYVAALKSLIIFEFQAHFTAEFHTTARVKTV